MRRRSGVCRSTGKVDGGGEVLVAGLGVGADDFRRGAELPGDGGDVDPAPVEQQPRILFGARLFRPIALPDRDIAA
ncbi:hypothetical protein AWN90_18665 [Nocardia terpenica]|uniref:Uncharacterized protein n=1 Tax=Nocardia terpenica TaxID=455432 RepID=A0A161WER9_9NOCA|nr:hypothetical protein AWN90_18665 [Nocardia terpenica]